MGRAAILVTKDELKQQLDFAESAQSFKNWSELFNFVANSEWGQSRVNSVGNKAPLTIATINSRVVFWGLGNSLKTPKGKRGREKGEVVVRRREMDISSPTIKSLIRQCDRYYYSGIWGNNTTIANVKRKRFLQYIERLKRGHLKAAIALKCIDCCNGSFSEVRNCELNDCALYELSPLTRK